MVHFKSVGVAAVIGSSDGIDGLISVSRDLDRLPGKASSALSAQKSGVALVSQVIIVDHPFQVRRSQMDTLDLRSRVDVQNASRILLTASLPPSSHP